MSLKLWLPLTSSTIENYVPTKINITKNNIPDSMFVDGKFGKCLQFDDTLRYISTDYSLNGFTNLSFSCWLNTSVDSSGYGPLIRGSQKYGLCFDQGDGNGWRVFLWTGTETYIGIINVQIPKNEWVNVVITYDGTNLRTYVNGVSKGVATTSGVEPIYMPGTLCLGYSAAMGHRLRNTKITDIRIYDEVLTNKEISELYKGKILHYTCNYIFGNPGLINMFPNTDKAKAYTTNQYWNASNHQNALEVEGWTTGYTGGTSQNDATYAMWIYDNGIPTMLLRDTNIGTYSTTRVCIETKDEFTFKPGTEYTISWDEKKTNTALVTTTVTIGSLSISSGGSSNKNIWERKSINFKPTGTLTGKIAFYPRPISEGVTNRDIYIKNPMLEVGKKGTASTRTVQGTVYNRVGDASGFMHYGNGVFSQGNSTAFGTGSFSFNGINDKIITERNFDLSNFTISTWIKPTDISNSVICSCGDFNITIESGKLKVSGNETSKTLVNNTWYNIVVTYSSSSCKVFVNGGDNVLHKAVTISSFGSDFNIATDNINYFKGEIADFRIYGTTLSDSECILLYKARATLDNKYNLYCSQYDELTARKENYANLNNSNPIGTANSNSVFTATIIGEVAGSNFKTYDGSTSTITNENFSGVNFAGGLVTSEFIEN